MLPSRLDNFIRLLNELTDMTGACRFELNDNVQNMHRYYEISVYKDLMDKWIVKCKWGRIGTNLGSSSSSEIYDKTALIAEITLQLSKRFKRGYQYVWGNGSFNSL
jgi:predicted DNA-binding WGR domain protein